MQREHSEKNSGWNRNNSPRSTFRIEEFEGQVHLVNSLGEVYPVDPNGSLALLALGALGTKAWRLAKKKHVK